MISLEEKIASLSPINKKRVEARTKILLKEFDLLKHNSELNFSKRKTLFRLNYSKSDILKTTRVNKKNTSPDKKYFRSSENAAYTVVIHEGTRRGATISLEKKGPKKHTRKLFSQPLIKTKNNLFTYNSHKKTTNSRLISPRVHTNPTRKLVLVPVEDARLCG